MRRILFFYFLLLSQLIFSCYEIKKKGSFKYDNPIAKYVSGSTEKSVSSAAPIYEGVAGRYTTNTPLPSEIDLNNLTGVISWRGEIVYGEYEILVNNSNGGSAKFILNVIDPATLGSFEYKPNKLNYIDGSSNLPIFSSIPRYKGSPGNFYLLKEVNSSNITINQFTGVISWINDIEPGTYIINVANENGGESTLELNVVKQLSTSGKFSYPVNVATYVSKSSNISIYSPNPIYSGTAGIYSTNTTLPSGIYLDPNTGQLVWSDSIEAGTHNIVVINTKGGTSTFSLKVTEPSSNSGKFSYPVDFASYENGSSITEILSEPPVYVGKKGIYRTFSILPTGMNLNPSDGTISWIDYILPGTYTIIVTNSNGGAALFTLRVYGKNITSGSFYYPSNFSSYVSGSSKVYLTSVAPIFEGFEGDYFTNTALPDGVKLVDTTGLIVWKETIEPGLYVIEVSNSRGGNDNYTLNVTATKPTGTFTFPVKSAIYASGSSFVSILSEAPVYVGIQDLFYPAVHLPQGISVEQSTGQVIWFGEINVGIYKITVVNLAGGSDTFTLEVI